MTVSSGLRLWQQNHAVEPLPTSRTQCIRHRHARSDGGLGRQGFRAFSLESPLASGKSFPRKGESAAHGKTRRWIRRDSSSVNCSSFLILILLLIVIPQAGDNGRRIESKSKSRIRIKRRNLPQSGRCPCSVLKKQARFSPDQL